MSREVTCPDCGSVFDPIEVPDEPIARLLTSMIDGGASPDVATDKAVSAFPESVAAYLRPTVRQQAHRIARNRDRKVEKETIGTEQRWLEKTAAMRAKLLATTFPLGAGIEVTWGEATRPQHEQRIKLLAEQRAGIDETVGRHRLALRLIDEAGASCLNEVPDGERVLAANPVKGRKRSVVLGQVAA
ncbi:MAG TPA: hypothetical protein VF163_18160 [Micromonosporaceae bacterium]